MTHVSSTAAPQLVARTRAITPPIDLLDHLGPDGFAWLGSDEQFVTSGIATTVAPEDAPDVLRTLDGARAVGALPFQGRGRLVIPAVTIGVSTDGTAWCTTVEPSDRPSPLRIASAAPTRFTVEACSTFEQWDTAVNDVLARDVEKVVLARAVRVDADRPFDIPKILQRLAQTQPGCTVYADGGFVGASPELLVRKRNTDVFARPLAGTGRDAAQLKASTKDTAEHRIVVDAMTRVLAEHCDHVTVTGPDVLPLTDVVHLATTITAQTDASVIDLVRALHPTPAVGGTPRAAALDAINTLEPVARGLYAGPCGWVDVNGDGEFIVALRCAAVEGSQATLHAGAGIVAGSNPAHEWAETQQKFDPMLRALVRP